MAVDVAMFLPNLGGGGAERVTVTLANGLAERGLSIDLVLVSAKGPHLVNVSPKVRVVNLNSRRLSLSVFRLARYFRRARPKSILSALGYANIIAVISKKLSGVNSRLVIAEHTNVSMSRLESHSIRGRVVFALMHWIYPKADKVVAVSKGVADDLIRVFSLPPDQVNTIYNPVITPELSTKAKRSVSCSWFEVGNPPVILSVGRMIAAKDYTTLIKAFSKVREVTPARLIILGDGDLRSDIEHLIESLDLQADVMLPGFVENPYSWMSRANLFVLSSSREGLPTVLIEAMACGVPVVSTNCPSGPYEVLEGGKWGDLVAVGDVLGLCDKIVEALNSPVKLDVTPRLKAFTSEEIIEEYRAVLLMD